MRPYILRAALCASFTALGAGGYAAANKVWFVDDPDDNHSQFVDIVRRQGVPPVDHEQIERGFIGSGMTLLRNPVDPCS